MGGARHDRIRADRFSEGGKAAEPFVVEGAQGKRVSTTYHQPERLLHIVQGSLTKDEARRIAKNIARLPELLKRPKATPAAS